MSLSRRVTIFHGRHRRRAEGEAELERQKYPGANVRVSGEQGKWKVRRDRLATDPAQVYTRTEGGRF